MAEVTGSHPTHTAKAKDEIHMLSSYPAHLALARPKGQPDRVLSQTPTASPPHLEVLPTWNRAKSGTASSDTVTASPVPTGHS
jgi:hypothetical protein